VNGDFEYHRVFRDRDAARKAAGVEVMQGGHELHVTGELPGAAIEAFTAAESDEEAEAAASDVMAPDMAAIDELVVPLRGHWTGSALFIPRPLPSLDRP
jgi:hypothetical protein